MKTYSVTKTGIKRQINQDSYLCQPDKIGSLSNLFIVADGMGGYKGGDFASSFCINKIKTYLEKERGASIISDIREAINTANDSLREIVSANSEYKGCGTTLVLATIKDKSLYVANIGDSRLYLARDGRLKQITEDHSLVEEMIRSGLLAREKARFHPDKNKVTRALGSEANVEADFFEIGISEGDRIMLCSDGASNMMSDEYLENLLTSDKDIKDITEKIVKTAVENGGKDDITVVMVEV